MPKWEYKDIEANNHKVLVAIANKEGAEGWELIDIEHDKMGFAIGIMKRQVD